MLKKIALPVVALVTILILTSAPAKAGVGIGVTIGPPAYTYPAYPYDPYYAAPYYDPYAYPGYYDYYAPAYVAPYYSYRGGFDRGHEFHERGGEVFRGGHVEHGFSGGTRGFSGGGAHGGHRR